MTTPAAANPQSVQPTVFDVRRVDRSFYTWHFEHAGSIVLGHGTRQAATEATARWVKRLGGRDV